MVTRRYVLAALMFLPALNFSAAAGAMRISAKEAHDKAATGAIILVDIRHPDEWKETGVGVPARPISMHKPGFLDKLETVTGGDKSKPLALICATGSRSAWLQRKLADFGYSRILNVAEGMLGSRDGPGWIRSGLAVKPYTP